MATFTTIADTVLEPGKPIRSVDTLALRDNPIAIADGETNAPRIRRRALAPESFGFQLFTASGTFTVPADVTLLKVTVIGGGGGGGAGIEQGYSIGTGGTGGGGGLSVGLFAVNPNQQFTVTVASGGAGTNATNNNGAAGGTSSFDTLLTASGGAGGIRSTTVTTSGDNIVAVSPGQSGSGGGGGTQRNSLLTQESRSIYIRPRGRGAAAIVYVLGADQGNSAGSGGQGEVGLNGNNAAGGVGGAVLVEF